jgi:hypothetical protein
MYYSRQKFHVPGKPTKKEPDLKSAGMKYGFTDKRYLSKDVGNWYADQACHLWEKSVTQGVRSFSFEMKRAQLLELPIPGSILLVDEAQDMDESQVSWVAEHRIRVGTHVYVVGDAAQSIYSFRGAKSRYLMEIQPTIDCSLTASWRFGSEIAAIANTVLFAKHKSIQSRPTPYKVDQLMITFRGSGGSNTGFLTV